MNSLADSENWYLVNSFKLALTIDLLPNIERRALQWNPQGQRNRGRPKNTWRRGVEQEMNEAGVTWGSLVAAAQDRVKWKQFVGGLCSTSGVIKA